MDHNGFTMFTLRKEKNNRDAKRNAEEKSRRRRRKRSRDCWKKHWSEQRLTRRERRKRQTDFARKPCVRRPQLIGQLETLKAILQSNMSNTMPYGPTWSNYAQHWATLGSLSHGSVLVFWCLFCLLLLCPCRNVATHGRSHPGHLRRSPLHVYRLRYF